MTKTSIGNALKEFRAIEVMTAKEAAERLGVTERFVYYIESGEKLPKNREHVAALAKLLDVTEDWIDHLCKRVPPDVIDYLSKEYTTVRDIRREMW